MDSKNAVRFENVFRVLLGNIRQSMILCTRGVRVTKENDRSRKPNFLFTLILGYLVMALAFLGFELVGHLMDWSPFHKQNSGIPGLSIAASMFQDIYVAWLEFRAENIAPVVQALCNLCIVIFIVQSLDRLLQLLGCLWIKIRDVKPIIEGDRYEACHLECSQPYYPMVLVQVPMCNEKEVYKQSISSVCQLDWPKNRLLIQVLDDSDDESIRLLLEGEVAKWSQRNVDIIYRHRPVRTGFKAGNLKSAMDCDYVRKYEFVAMFDADFQPKQDFLKRTIPHFKDNPELGLVQARWAFVNNSDNLLTRLQNINMCYHFEVEQQVNGVFINFFGFNGTAGVWRIKALEESGGWLDRTTVEDMDIAVRAHLDGWKFIFLNDVKVPCELPGNFESYRKQQYRWHSGPIHLFRLCLPSIITSRITLWKKANLMFLFFLLRKLILPFYTFTFSCLILPLTMFVPEAKVPAWVIFHVPVLLSFLNTWPRPNSIPLSVPYLLFEGTMSVIKFEAIVSGLLHLGSSHEWVVTKKSGCSSRQDRLQVEESELKALRKVLKGDANGKISELNGLNKHQGPAYKPCAKKTRKIYSTELAVGFLLLTAAFRSLLSGPGVHFYVLVFQGIAFLLVGLAQIGD